MPGTAPLARDALSCPLGYFHSHFPRVAQPARLYSVCVIEAESVFPYGESSQMLGSHLIILPGANQGAPARTEPAQGPAMGTCGNQIELWFACR